jgi:hypothetical protein
LTPLADLGRSAGQAPLHRLHAAGTGAGADDAAVAVRLLERARVDVRLFGRRLETVMSSPIPRET